MLSIISPIILISILHSKWCSGTAATAESRIGTSFSAIQNASRQGFVPEMDGSSKGELTFSKATNADGTPKFAYVWSKDELRNALEPLEVKELGLKMENQREVLGENNNDDGLKKMLSSLKGDRIDSIPPVSSSEKDSVESVGKDLKEIFSN
mmetsp:Transcript_31380/g.76559  ORF Transcript_31380/g.76559 Transcript_31380/m.76559 type:complete len:152 (-) Transcript_31380:129-584(-)